MPGSRCLCLSFPWQLWPHGGLERGLRVRSRETGKASVPGTLEGTADRAFHGVTWAHVYQALMGQTLSGAQGQPGGPELRAQELSWGLSSWLWGFECQKEGTRIGEFVLLIPLLSVKQDRKVRVSCVHALWMQLAANSSLEKSGLRWFMVYTVLPVCVTLGRSQCSHL